MRRSWLLACAASLVACYRPDLDACKVRCSEGCPASLVCGDDGFCHVHAADTCLAIDAGPTHSISVALDGTADGHVTSQPAGIDCPGTCSAAFPSGTPVSLVATPGPSALFSHWSGACTTDPCDLLLDADRQVIATFDSSFFAIVPGSIELVEGTRNNFSVHLAADPVDPLTVDVTSDDAARVVATPPALLFDNGNWPLAQQVAITAAEDDDGDTNLVTITLDGNGTIAHVPVTSIDRQQLVALGSPGALGVGRTLDPGLAYAYLMPVDQATKLVGFGANSAGNAGATMALYTDDSGQPGALVFALPQTLAFDGTPDVEFFDPLALAAGNYWLAVRVDVSVPVHGQAAVAATECTTPVADIATAWPSLFASPTCNSVGKLGVFADTWTP